MNFNRFLLYILLGLILFGTCFHIVFSNSFCLESTLTTTIWNSYNIASEYFVARSGSKLVGGDTVSTDISGVSGISSGYMNPDYGDINAGIYNKTPINASALMELAKDVDVSNYSASELNSISYALANAPWTTDGSIVFKNIAFGGVSLYFAVNKAGEWLGNSYDNILANFQTKSAALDSNIQTYTETNYEYQDLLYSAFLNGSPTIFPNYKFIDFYFGFSVYIYTVPTSDPNKYSVHLVMPSDHVGSFTNSANCRFQYSWDNTMYTSSLGYRSRSLFSINNVEYADILPYVVSEGEDLYYTGVISSLDLIKAKITSDGYIGESINSELVDTQGVPYLADDLGEFATTIGDIYEVIDELRDSILGIPINDELTSIIDDAIEANITDLIEAIKAKAITLEDSFNNGGDDDDGPEYNLPVGIFPDFVPDLLPDDMFSMFKPVFDIVGVNYSMYDLWSIIPSILIFILILYLIVSLF